MHYDYIYPEPKACVPEHEVAAQALEAAEKAEADAWTGSLAGKLNMPRMCADYPRGGGFVFYAAIIACLFWIFVRELFINPLEFKRRMERGIEQRIEWGRKWVSVKGIFLSKLKSAGAEINIIKGEKLKQYSVADELLKWAKLKEDGHITEEEFNEARTKLLNRK